jgi:hypothetical protein
MAKSNLQKLQEALASGDVEAAKLYAAKIEGAKAPKKKVATPPKKKVATPPKKAKPSKKAPVVPEDDFPETEGPDDLEDVFVPPASRQSPSRASSLVLPGDFNYNAPTAGQYGGYGDDSSWQATTMRPGGFGNRGADRVEARKVSMANRKHINLFDDWMHDGGQGADKLSPREKKMEKAIANSPVTPRPGQRGAMRPPAQKTHINCDGCGRPFDVYPSELTQTHEDNGRPYIVYICDRCVKRGRR